MSGAVNFFIRRQLFFNLSHGPNVFKLMHTFESALKGSYKNNRLTGGGGLPTYLFLSEQIQNWQKQATNKPPPRNNQLCLLFQRERKNTELTRPIYGVAPEVLLELYI